jgi:hypothetical protein
VTSSKPMPLQRRPFYQVFFFIYFDLIKGKMTNMGEVQERRERDVLRGESVFFFFFFIKIVIIKPYI